VRKSQGSEYPRSSFPWACSTTCCWSVTFSIRQSLGARTWWC
jgi:hypothetical protein